jgi:hypothetical protein
MRRPTCLNSPGACNRADLPREALALPWILALAVGVLTVSLSASQAQACTDDKDCKGDRICDRSVCKTPRVAAPDPAPPAVAGPPVVAPPLPPAPPTQVMVIERIPEATPLQTEPLPSPVTPPPLVVIEPAPPTAQPEPPPSPVPPAQLVMIAPAPPATQPVAVTPATLETPPSSDGSYAPAAGFRCLVGQAACAFQLRPLDINWTHVDVHGDLLLGGLTGGDFGLGAGTRYWRIGGAGSPFKMVFRWDNDLVVVSGNYSAGVTLLTFAVDTGPRVGVSVAVSHELALEATLSGGLFLGYGAAINGGANQWMLAGYTGVLLGARM